DMEASLLLMNLLAAMTMNLRNNRGRKKIAARQKSRPQRKIYLVICEGEVTEKEYLEGYRRTFRNGKISLHFPPDHGVPLSLVRIAKDLKKAAERVARNTGDRGQSYDQVWCVFDVDAHPNLARAMDEASANGIELAISNPCFELWLLLHFRDSPGMQSRSTIQRMLKNYVNGYVKHVDFSQYEDRVTEAVSRATRISLIANADGEPGRNPTTGVYRLIESINGDRP
ncbi:MAG: RloB domain-containing protein, partial [Deltaproteobacteria bacterium]|nr:RloB domain-containing protein [Deltaproteobacteria bacterium]